jgi:ParB/RepB/Spo0J family partition protein
MSTLTHKIASKADEHFVWPTVGQSGTVPIDSCVPNPNNARKWFDPEKISALAQSMRKDDQCEIATVRELWPHEQAIYPHARYMITSGESRWRAKKEAGQTTYNILVKEYQDLAHEGKHGFLLNERRTDLSDLEKAWEIDRLAKLHGWQTQQEIADELAMELWEVSDFHAILKCSPKVQDRMHPRHKSERLGKLVAEFLAPYQHSVQDDLIDRMPAELKTSAAQIAWMRNDLKSHGLEAPRRVRKPQTMRRILQAFASNLKQKADDFNAAPEIVRLFENVNDEEAEQFAVDLRNALIAFEKVVERVEQLSEGEKKQTMLVAREHMPWQRSKPLSPQDVVQGVTRIRSERTSAPAAASPVSRKVEVAETPNEVPIIEPRRRDMIGASMIMRTRSSNEQSSAPLSMQSGRKVVSVWQPNSGRYASQNLSSDEIAELKGQGLLKSEREPSG